MTAIYVGTRKTAKLKKPCRMAEIAYSDNETTFAQRVFDLLEIKGWEVDAGVENWAAVQVEDRDEFNVFMKDFKEAKTCIRNCVKFGF